MTTLRIEHPVFDFDAWKQAFDGDPIGRERAGVRRYGVFRSLDDPNFVLVDLEFDTVAEAEAMRGSLERMWKDVVGSIITEPQTRIVHLVDSKEY